MAGVIAAYMAYEQRGAFSSQALAPRLAQWDDASMVGASAAAVALR
jgi:hypothetical protein